MTSGTCGTCPPPGGSCGICPGSKCSSGSEGDKKCNYDCKAKTLLTWAVCKEEEKEQGAEKGGKGAQNSPANNKPAGNAPNAPIQQTSAMLPGQLPPPNHLPAIVGNAANVKDAAYPNTLAVPASESVIPKNALNSPPSNNASKNSKNNRFKKGGPSSPSGRLSAANSGQAASETGAAPAPEEQDTIKTDRPDFTEASSTVGLGRIQLEAGYTFGRDRAEGVTTHSHSFPEILLRIGLFAEWFELRIGQNFGNERVGPSQTIRGAQDLYLGTKIALTEQNGIFPETAMILQTTVPTGAQSLTGHNNVVLPGMSFLFSWDLAENWALAGSILGNKAVDETNHNYTEFASSLSIGHAFSDKIGGYFEYFGFYPHSAAAHVRPEYYLDGGFTYLVTSNFQLDIRAGVGLNKAADDFFTGVGFAVRY